MTDRKHRPHIRTTTITERIDGILWRKLSDAVMDDGAGGYWIPERNVIDCGKPSKGENSDG